MIKIENDTSENIPGVYFIYNQKKKLIYIGQSKNITKRITQHRYNSAVLLQKQMFYYEYIHINDKEIRENVEEEFIIKLRPFFNGWATTNYAELPPIYKEEVLDYFKTGEIMIYAYESGHEINNQNRYFLLDFLKKTKNKMEIKDKMDIHKFLSRLNMVKKRLELEEMFKTMSK